MQRTGSSGGLRRLGKQAAACLLLGLVLQYGVAAGFGLAPTKSISSRGWVLGGVANGQFEMFDLRHGVAAGRDVLFAIVSVNGVLGGSTATPDWSAYAWQVFGTGNPKEPDTPPAWSRFAAIRTDPDFEYYPSPEMEGVCVEVASGWPLRSASYVACSSSTSGVWAVREGTMVSNVRVDLGVTPRVIPWAIHWTGALLNTLVYAAVPFVPLCLVPWIRTLLRQRRGKCLACGYDLRGAEHAVCPECGSGAWRETGCGDP